MFYYDHNISDKIMVILTLEHLEERSCFLIGQSKGGSIKVTQLAAGGWKF